MTETERKALAFIARNGPTTEDQFIEAAGGEPGGVSLATRISRYVTIRFEDRQALYTINAEGRRALSAEVTLWRSFDGSVFVEDMRGGFRCLRDAAVPADDGSELGQLTWSAEELADEGHGLLTPVRVPVPGW